MKLLDWLEDRTGYRHLVHEALFERIPGGARWRYVWGSTLTFTFAVQVITGIFLWMAYSPSTRPPGRASISSSIRFGGERFCAASITSLPRPWWCCWCCI